MVTPLAPVKTMMGGGGEVVGVCGWTVSKDRHDFVGGKKNVNDNSYTQKYAYVKR